MHVPPGLLAQHRQLARQAVISQLDRLNSNETNSTRAINLV